ncbi:MAG: nuclear transport factor 2 family protein [Acidimicrobiia bacterium]
MEKPGRLGKDKVVGLERELARAVQGRDLDKIDRILAAEFTLATGRPGAEVRSREEYLDVTRDRYVVHSFEFDSIEPRVYGHVAVVRSRYRQEGRLDGEDRSGAYLFTDVWVRRAGRWQLVTRHLSPLH